MEAGSYMCILVVTSFSTQIVLFLGEKILINRLLGKKNSKSMLEYKQFPNNNRHRHMRTYLIENCDLPKVS